MRRSDVIVVILNKPPNRRVDGDFERHGAHVTPLVVVQMVVDGEKK